MKKFWGLFMTIMFFGGILLFGSCGSSLPANLPEFEVKALGNNTFMAGSQGSLRIIAYDPSNQKPVPKVPIRIFFEKTGIKGTKGETVIPAGSGTSVTNTQTPKKKLSDYGDLVYTGNTDVNGTVTAAFKIPEDKEGSLKLTILAGLEEKLRTIETQIKIEKKFKIYLTTDKPLYQPSQTINIRALALAVPSLKPIAEKEIVLEVQDAKGNKVFKKKGKTSKFGIYHTKFELADEVNLGEFKVSAFLENESAEKSVTVKKYVLPKFKIDFKKDKTFYIPGETIKGDIQVDYFFGKPVAGGKVTLKLHSFDVEFRQVAEAKGVTDKTGHYSFELKIPDYLVGQPLEKGGAVTKLDIEVVDTADHKETTIKMIPVSKDALKIEVFPESGSLKPNLENKVYLLTSYPDGSPAKANVTIKSGEEIQTIKTDEAGISSFNLKPENTNPMTLQLTARTEKGDEVNTSKTLSVVSSGEENVILRTDKAQYKVGDTIKMQVLSTKGKGSFYLDFVKNRQTVLTKALEVNAPVYSYNLEATPEIVGMVTIHAYRITDKGQIIRDSRNIYIAEATDLKIEAKPDKEEYKPGEDAKIDFTVTDKTGQPVLSALGVDIVDEALFAMGELMPGIERVYFMLEKQLMEPKYEIHGMTISQAIMPTEKINEDQQAVRQVLFSQIPVEWSPSINIDTFREKLLQCYQKMARIHDAMYQYYSKKHKYPDVGDLSNLVKETFLKEDDIIDPWGHKFYLAAPSKYREVPEIKSMGPDGKMGTPDELSFQELSDKIYSDQNFEGFARQREMIIEDRVMALPPGAQMPIKAMKAKADIAEKGSTGSVVLPSVSAGAAPQKQVKVREYFPETLYTNPEIITDEKGNAQISLAMADSITTWRLTAFANSLKGEMGNMTKGLKVFQDFFIDIDFPVALTEGDEISVPIAVYNYLKDPQTVKITVEKADWFQMISDKYEQEVQLQKDEVKAVYFRIKTVKIGKQKLTVHAQGSKMSDAIRREIEILPNGEMMLQSKSDRLGQEVVSTVQIPQWAIPGASKILVRIYPGVISQVVEGLDKIFQMPYGCFEQTSSSTYPNVLVLDYLKKHKKITPELQMKAEGYINTGYQRLVSFEVQGGGFSWFGSAPANQILTAFGLLEFRDMSRVHEVDPNVINRTQAWLARQQNKDGSWSPDKNYLHAESWSKIQGGGNMPVTAYIVWALAESGYKGNDLTKGMDYLKKNAGQINDPYILALVCNAFASVEPTSQFTAEMMKKLEKSAKVTAQEAYWETGIQTGTYSHGKGANLETTAIAAMACLKVPGYENLATKAISYLVKAKDPNGTWYSTQATILTMKALILAQEKAGEKVNAKVKITVNDKRSEEFNITSENYDVYHQADFGDVTINGANKVSITITGQGSCYYQIATKYFVPWKETKKELKPLSIDVKYDRTTLKENDMLTSEVSIRNNTKAFMKMVMVDLGVPPGFTLMSTDLNEYVGTKFVKYTLTSRQVIIYMETIKPGETINFKYRLQAKFPLRAKTPESKTWQYYNPEVRDTSQPVTLEVKG